MSDFDDEPVELPIDGTLDLHTFLPDEVKDLVPAYIEECRKKGIYHVRIIHGKGTGSLKTIVQSLLEKNPNVLRFGHESGFGGGWGATVVDLRR